MCRVTTYDEKILVEYADSLYQKARTIIASTAIDYGIRVFLLSVAVLFVGAALRPGTINEGAFDNLMFIVVVLTAVGVAGGISAGRRKAFNLKLQAQQLLCQRQIELNTRR